MKRVFVPCIRVWHDCNASSQKKFILALRSVLTYV